QLDHLRAARLIKIDGTFKIVTKPHKQLFTIHSNIGNPDEDVSTPLCYVLMSGKRKVDYVAVLQKLKSEVEKDGRPMKLECVLMDFEIAFWQAVEEVFGRDVRRRGCWFHFTQAIYMKVNNLKLSQTYHTKGGFYIMVRRLMCLAMVDDTNIENLFLYLKARYSEEINSNAQVKKFFDYFEETWISGKFYSPADWCCYREDTRTNNELENWNGQIWHSGGKKKLHIYLLAELLHKDAIGYFDRFLLEPENTTKKKQRTGTES
ncbi:unnamed protein product, partial [Meganyctiphanes norvegica]